MARTALTDAPQVPIDGAVALRDWLVQNGDRHTGVWIVTWKKGDPRHLPWPAIVDECLCQGWVDSLPRKVDDARAMLWIAPRKAGSNWSKVNRDKVAVLMAAGRMQPAGRAAVDRAKADFSWTALDTVEALIVPEDLADALTKVDGARTQWDGLPRSARRGALEQLVNAKRPDTRAARIAIIIEAAAQGGRPFEWRPAIR